MALKLQFKDQPERYVVIAVDTLTLGRDSANDMVLDAADISDFHAEVTRNADEIYIEDLLSGSGTFVNGERISRRTKLCAWDVLRLGPIELELNDPSIEHQSQWYVDVISSDGSTSRYNLADKILVGRDPDCQIVLDHELISRRHFELCWTTNHVDICDLDSVNGTYLNGRSISQAIAYSGDEIQVDPFMLKVVGPAKEQHDSTSDRTRVKSDDSTEFERTQQFGGDESRTEQFDQSFRVACLVSEAPALRGQRFALLNAEYTLGRSTECDIVLADPSISKKHAKLQQQHGQWFVVDLGSSNGTLVNGLLVYHAPLNKDDRISIGRVDLIFSEDLQNRSI